MFIGREKEIQHIYESLEAYRHSRSAHLLYVGDHKIGKTALLRNVETMLMADSVLVPLYFDFRMLVTTPEDFQVQFIERGLKMINRHIQAHSTEVASLLPSSFTSLYTHDLYSDLFKGYSDLSRQGKLEHVLKILSKIVQSLGRKVVYLLDNVSEFSALENFPDISHSDHVLSMALLTRETFSISVALPGDFTWASIRGEIFSPHNKEVLFLDSLTKEEVLSVQMEGVDFSREQIEDIYTISGGNPLYYSVLFQIARNVGVSELNQRLEKELLEESYLYTLCEKKFLYILERSRYYGPLKLLLKFLASREGLSQKEMSSVMAMRQGVLRNYLVDLEKLGVVVRRGHGYFFADPLFKRWLIANNQK